MDLKEWKKKNKFSRKYAHFDKRTNLQKVWKYISMSETIAKHGFYPFIHYEYVQKKFKDGKPDSKIRNLSYSAHIDRYIYSYYGFLLNQSYNKYVLEKGVQDIAVAYRDNLNKSNIHFAKEVFDFIRDCDKCYILIGDFTDFFDSLDHKYLKEKICSVLGVGELPTDYYAVFKNITRYSTVELQDLLSLNGFEDTDKGKEMLNSLDRVADIKELKKLSKDNDTKYIKTNSTKRGIPQGSAISAILSNIYMIDFDEQINLFAERNTGRYMRYSDDFILVLPNVNEQEFAKLHMELSLYIKNIPGLELQSKKTQVFKYEASKLENKADLLGNQNNKGTMDYLGFTFDGNEVTIRDKTISKYYYRLYRKLKTIKKQHGYTRSGKRISCKNVYEKYSLKGAKITGEYRRGTPNKKGNFISYVQRAENIFGERSIGKKTRRHMVKIRRKIDEAFSD